MRLLFACDYLVASGGLLRLERVGRALREHGHECAYVLFSPHLASDFTPEFPVYTFEQAAASEWNATLIPGAGFPVETIEAFARLRASPFGLRVQMVLNDQHKRENFLHVNSTFKPDLVVFNNEHWQPGSFRDFAAKQFHYLIGAVDTHAYHPRQQPSHDDRFVIGAQAAKNPTPMIEALDQLPSDCVLRFFGFDRSGAVVAAMPHRGSRVEYTGPLFDDALAQYYRGLNAMVSTEDKAGWANVVAEAMAAGVPVVTTPAGTLSIAKNDETAIVIEEATSAALAASILRLKDDRALRERLVKAAREHIEQYDWQTYSQRLLELLRKFDGESHYTLAHEQGLYGKAPVSERTQGLDRLFEIAPTIQSMLDIGSAEGVISSMFLARGVARADAWELDKTRVAIGQTLFGTMQGFTIGQCDLASEHGLEKIANFAPSIGYDLTLYLGVHQHLPPERRMAVVQKLLALTAKRFALRTPDENIRADNLIDHIRRAGFELEYSAPAPVESFAASLHVFRRSSR